MLIYVNTTSSKRKNKKPTKKQAALRDSWQKILDKYDTKPVATISTAKQDSRPIREVQNIPSLVTMAGNCNKQPEKVYTGTAIIGLSTMHKSNIVPVFSQQEAEAHAKMRRG